MTNQAFILLCMVVFGVVGSCHGGSLKKGFYNNTCPNAEAIIKNATEKRVASDPTLPARFLRMHFHDFCTFLGCDASVLLNSTTNNTAEKDAIPNLTLAGFDVIDDIKAEVEKKCPNVVSCADVLALAARDAVSFKVSQTPLWEVLTGRRDSRVSRISEALANLPSPFSNFTILPLSLTSPPFSKTLLTKALMCKTWWSYQSDAALLTNKSSRDVVDKLLASKEFFKEFAKSMEKMGAIGVLTGNAGEIRKKCYVVN
ncbi:hypothetical protein CXB51_034006 [Gossypium anomalum]|uniref:peroxidase n=1 Tax=Gossypium anomalum TaxID=47600 RepID=A0A8J6CK85_9ROSI|nr:hypothetical protein CXB51_034006 [Gossypium anomalum]